MDFGENYSFAVQDAVHGFHWNNSQATLHLFIVYFNIVGKIESLSCCIISDHMSHDANVVHIFTYHMIENLKLLLPETEHCYYFSVGALSQYKNNKNLTNLMYHEQEH